jgi:hypothetical protein
LRGTAHDVGVVLVERLRIAAAEEQQLEGKKEKTAVQGEGRDRRRGRWPGQSPGPGTDRRGKKNSRGKCPDPPGTSSSGARRPRGADVRRGRESRGDCSENADSQVFSAPPLVVGSLAGFCEPGRIGDGLLAGTNLFEFSPWTLRSRAGDSVGKNHGSVDVFVFYSS